MASPAEPRRPPRRPPSPRVAAANSAALGRSGRLQSPPTASAAAPRASMDGQQASAAVRGALEAADERFATPVAAVRSVDLPGFPSHITMSVNFTARTGKKPRKSALLRPEALDVDVFAVPVAAPAPATPGAAAQGAAKASSPFEKLNTLKLLLDCGHLTADEYRERKNQIINEMTGTSTERARLQPIMKTVVPHRPPDFGRIRAERADKLSFDVDTLEWRSAPARVKIDLVPFATGQLRSAYYLQELGAEGMVSVGPPALRVAKFSIRPAEPSSYLSDVEMQAVCAHYAALYNEHEPPLKVYYARSWLLKLKDRGDLVCSVEEFLPGAYVKYSNNNGYVGRETSSTEERERNTPQAFSHFSFVASDFRLMIVDIQGVNDSYTDPQIHTADGQGFGAGNLGTLGMEKFLESHRCNEVCRWLGLRSINEQYKPGGTAAPAYQMPFGGAIKKSTNRITEERNTFSTSVTVSEAFGDGALATLDPGARPTDSPIGLRHYELARARSGPSGPSSLGLPIKRGRSADLSGRAPAWWRLLQRLLCWCW